MNNSGIPKPDGIVIRRPRLLLLVGGVALILVIFIITQVIGVLYGIVFPPAPPVPSGVRELRHESTEYGFDKWVYGVDQNPCDVLSFYQERATSCILAPLRCDSQDKIDVNTPGQHVGRCEGESTFSIFTLKWNVNIATGDNSTGETQFSLEREIYWMGSPPQPTP